MNVFAVDIMWGAMFFGTLHLLFLVLLLFFLYKLMRAAYKFHSGPDEELTPQDRRRAKFYAVACIVLFGIFAFSSSGAVRPKISLNPMDNRNQVIYEQNQDPVTIVTPAPRTEHLDGFRSLQQSD